MPVTFLKRGREAHEAMARADAEAEIRKKQSGVRRFWVPKESDALVTFLDGDLDKHGLLDVTSYHEHRLKINGSWRNYFPCTAGEEPCPLCEQGAPSALVTLFTVMDHAVWKDRNGKRHSNERKLFVAKRDTMKRLQKAATKRGGLAGWRVSISRVGDRAPEVGTDFDFIEQVDLSEMADELKLKAEDVQPYDYDEVIHYFTADELREMGFGSPVVGQHDTKKLKAGKKPVVADDDDDNDDDDDGVPEKPTKKGLKFKPKPAGDDDDDDTPVVKAPAKKAKAKPVVDDDDHDDDDDNPFDDDDDDDQPAKPVKGKAKVSSASKPSKPSKQVKKPVDDDDDDDDADD